MSERELSEPVDLCASDGRLNPDAVGFSRRPLHRCNLSGHWPRKKRWDYWCITTDSHLIALTYADVDYLGLVDLWFFEFESGRAHHHPAAVPLARSFSHSLRVNEARVEVDVLGLQLSFRDEPGGTRLSERPHHQKCPLVQPELPIAPMGSTTSMRRGSIGARLGYHEGRMNGTRPAS